MTETAGNLKLSIKAILGDVPSSIFMSRVDSTIDEAAGDLEKLPAACQRVENMVKLFIGVEQAREVGARCREILEA